MTSVQSNFFQTLTFILGIIFGSLILSQLIDSYILWVKNQFNNKNCLIHDFAMEVGEDGEDCRNLINCEMCLNVTEIDIIPAYEMTRELFSKKYDSTGRPVLIKNATSHWQALKLFNFEFFRDLYHNLNSPVLINEDPDCEFLSWDFDFNNLQEAFNMSIKRWPVIVL